MSQPPAGNPSQAPDFATPWPPAEPPVAFRPVADPAGGQLTAPAAEPAERVGRGVLFSLAAIPLGVVLTVVIWQLGFVASISAFALAAAAVWLYSRGAGRAPARGAFAVVGVIVLGVVLSMVGMIASDLAGYLAEEYPGIAVSDQVAFVIENLGSVKLWQAYGGDIAMFTLFAALGTFGVIRQLGRAKA